MKYIQGMSWDGCGRCIYCSESDKDALVRERIIPLTLKGEWTIREGKCEKCARIINDEFERYFCKVIYGPLRLAHSYRRNKKGELPEKLPVKIQYEDRIENLMVPIDQLPIAPVLAPILPPPGIFIGRKRDIEINYHPFFQKLTLISPEHDERLSRIAKDGYSRIDIEAQFEFPIFMRELAKIAHGFAAMIYGLDSFEPYLPDYILGWNKNIFDVVGTVREPLIEDTTEDIKTRDRTHAWQIGTCTDPVDHRFYVFVNLQLFRYLNFPVYQVIAGLASDELIRKTQSLNQTQSQS